MSRQFKLKISNGFTSPKQPSHRQSTMTKHKHPTFLTLTQNINNNNYNINTDRQRNYQLQTIRINNINNNTQRVSNTTRHMNSTQRFDGDNSIHNFHIQQFKPQIMKEQDKRKKEQEIKNNLIKGIGNISNFLKSKLFKFKKTSIKSIIAYGKNKQSIKLMSRFKQHCAIIIQKQFRRFIAQKYYQQFRIFVNRIKPSINAFQQGWKLRKIMKLKPVTCLIASIKNSKNQKQSRILKRQLSSQITRLFKKNKWLNYRQQQKTKSNIHMKSALLDKQFQKQSILKQPLKHSLVSIIQTQNHRIKDNIIESKNVWQDIPIKPMNKQSFDQYQQQSKKIEYQLPQKQKQQKIVKKLNMKSNNTSIPKKSDRIHSNDQIIVSKKTKQTPQNRQLQKQQKQKSKQKSLSNKKIKTKGKSQEVSKQKSSKQLLLEKRTKYDPRKASQQSRVKNLLQVEQNKSLNVQSIIISPKNSSILQPIKQVPKFQPQNKRNILPKEISVSLSKTQKINFSVHQPSRVIKQKHVGIGQLQNVFYNTYGNKMTCVVQKLKKINRTSLKDMIPQLKVNSNFYRQYNPRYFNTFANRTISTYQQ